MALRSPPPSGSGIGLRRAAARTAARDARPAADCRPGPAASNACCSTPCTPSRRSGRPVQRGARPGHHRRAVRLPGVLVLAHPLHAHRPAGQRQREQRRIGRGIVGAVVAIAARALDVDAAHLLGRQPGQLGERAAQRIDALAVRPYRQRAVLEQRDRAGRSDRAVHLIRPPIARLDDARRRAACSIGSSRTGTLLRRQRGQSHRTAPPGSGRLRASRPIARPRPARASPRSPGIRARRRRRDSCRRARP